MHIVFDTECYKSRVLVLCAYFVEEEKEKVYCEKELMDFSKLANGKNKFIGFNIFDFDYKMLNKYFDTQPLCENSLDILKEVRKMAGKKDGFSLEKLSVATLGLRKNGNGYQAIKWFQKGAIQQVIEYCKNDVYLTYKIYEFGKKNSFVYALEKDGTKKLIKVNWKDF
jgi:DEAD/DEAH box helicase domain-containing protein